MVKKTPSSEAEKIAEEFQDFTYIISHDLNAPMRGVVEFSKLLKEDCYDALNEEGREYLSIILDNGKKMQNMLQGLLAYSRVNTEKNPVSSIDCGAMLDHCLQLLEAPVKDSGAKIEVINNLPAVTADRQQLTQLLTALLDNAVKFRKPGVAPSIKISADKKGDDCIFTVEDNGIGIESQFYDRIFKPFQRLHTESEYPGVGMGLAIARKIAERHGGDLRVASTPGTGSAFICTIPNKGAAT